LRGILLRIRVWYNHSLKITDYRPERGSEMQ